MEIKIDMGIKTIFVISGFELKSSFAKHEYGTSQPFQVLDEKQFQDIFKLAEETLKCQFGNIVTNII